MSQIGIGIVGGGYMGKAHAVAMTAVGALLGTTVTAGGERLARLALPAVSVLAIGVGVVWIVG